MAQVIPSSLPSRATTGERRLHTLLARLPEDCVVYYEPQINGRRPDFVVIIPQLGVLIIEEKGWYATTLGSVDANSVTLLREGQSISTGSPLKQARNYLFNLMDEARRHRWSKCLLHSEGKHQGRFHFPFAAIVVLSNISQAALGKRNVDRDDWDRVFPSDRTLTRDALASLENKSESELLNALRHFVHPSWSFPPLTVEEVRILRAIVHPEILLGEQPRLPSDEPPTESLDSEKGRIEVLDLRQEDHAQAMGEGHRIVYGVAGSGKTILLLARARRLAQSGSERLLITCYNRALAAWMRERLRDLPNIVVKNFHQWAHSCGVKWQPNESAQDFGARFLRHLELNSNPLAKWDAILIDEAQDFEPLWFRCLLGAMRDPENGDLLIVADGCQSLYGRSKIRWSDLGIKARGRSVSAKFHLDRNYRNTCEIVAAAESFAQASSVSEDTDTIKEMRIDLGRCQRKNGIKPVLMRCPDRKSEGEQIASLVGDLLEGRWRGRAVGAYEPHEIALLYPSASPAEKERIKALQGRLGNRGIPVVWLTGDQASRDQVDRAGVKIQTIHSAKGLQYRAVIVIWADKLPNLRRGSEGELADRRLLYVAMTRAVSLLALTAYGKSKFIDELASTSAVETVKVPPQ